MLKAVPETKRSITLNDLHLLTMLTKFDTRLSVLLGDLSFSNIALSYVSNVGSI